MSIELPPLTTYDHECVDDYGDFRSKMVEDNLGEWVRVIEVEARERILLARIAELEADAERYRWLRDHGRTEDLEFDEDAWESAHKALGWTRSAEEIDAAIDAARGKE